MSYDSKISDYTLSVCMGLDLLYGLIDIGNV